MIDPIDTSLLPPDVQKAGPAAQQLYAGALASGALTHRVDVLGWHATGLGAYLAVVAAGVLGYQLGSILGWWIGERGGRPFLERYGKYLLIRQHEIELAERFFDKYGAATAFFSRLLPIVRTFISFPAGVARMNLPKFIVYSTAGAFVWSMVLVYAGTVLGANWAQIRHALQPFDLLIAVAVVAAAVTQFVAVSLVVM